MSPDGHEKAEVRQMIAEALTKTPLDKAAHLVLQEVADALGFVDGSGRITDHARKLTAQLAEARSLNERLGHIIDNQAESYQIATEQIGKLTAERDEAWKELQDISSACAHRCIDDELTLAEEIERICSRLDAAEIRADVAYAAAEKRHRR